MPNGNDDADRVLTCFNVLTGLTVLRGIINYADGSARVKQIVVVCM